MSIADPGPPSAALARRAIALVYESLLLTAVLLAGTAPFVVIAHGAPRDVARPLLQLYLLAVTGLYFAWQWQRGSTLAMRTWHLRLVTRAGGAVTWRHVLVRYLCALGGTALLGAGFAWALIDREALFLHDRLAGTKIIHEREVKKGRPAQE